MMFEPAAHTDGDSMVFFRRSDVLATGEIFNENSYPVINLAEGGSINGVIKALNVVLDITIPKHEQEGGTYVIPGHGRLTDEHDVLEYRDMVTIIRDRVREHDQEGDDAGPGEGSETDFRIRWTVGLDDGSLDDGYVCRGGI